jgi:6,7-dimethyl-8-ribityllumazine synthase
MARTIESRLSPSTRKFAIVAARWNEFVGKQLVEGAERAFRKHALVADVVWVPGTWEIPSTALVLAERGYSGVVAVGCILQGATIHASQLSNQVAAALSEISLKTGVPVTWGVLTCDTQEEAIERAGMKLGNKGEEAANAAIEMASVIGQIADQEP